MKRFFKDPKIWAGFGVIVLEYVCFQVLDLVKPGVKDAVGAFIETVVRIVTLGSSRVINAPYSSASLDPYSVPSLLLLAIVVMLPLNGLIMLHGSRVGAWAAKRSKLRKLLKQLDSSESLEKRAIVLRTIKCRVRVRRYMLLAMTIVLAIPSLLALYVINESILVRRVFETDRDIIAPYLTEQQLRLLQGQFAAVETRDDFVTLMDHVTAIADAHHVKLRKEGNAFR